MQVGVSAMQIIGTALQSVPSYDAGIWRTLGAGILQGRLDVVR